MSMERVTGLTPTDFVPKLADNFGIHRVTSPLGHSLHVMSAPLLGDSGYDTHDTTGRTR